LDAKFPCVVNPLNTSFPESLSISTLHSFQSQYPLYEPSSPSLHQTRLRGRIGTVQTLKRDPRYLRVDNPVYSISTARLLASPALQLSFTSPLRHNYKLSECRSSILFITPIAASSDHLPQPRLRLGQKHQGSKLLELSKCHRSPGGFVDEMLVNRGNLRAIPTVRLHHPSPVGRKHGPARR
jgi:hypothetical protein